MNDWHEEFKVICSSIPLEQCDLECWGECAARRRMLDELQPAPAFSSSLRAKLGIQERAEAAE